MQQRLMLGELPALDVVAPQPINLLFLSLKILSVAFQWHAKGENMLACRSHCMPSTSTWL